MTVQVGDRGTLLSHVTPVSCAHTNTRTHTLAQPLAFVHRPFFLASLPDLPHLGKKHDLLRLPDLVIAETVAPNAHSRKKKKDKGSGPRRKILS